MALPQHGTAPHRHRDQSEMPCDVVWKGGQCPLKSHQETDSGRGEDPHSNASTWQDYLLGLPANRSSQAGSLLGFQDVVTNIPKQRKETQKQAWLEGIQDCPPPRTILHALHHHRRIFRQRTTTHCRGGWCALKGNTISVDSECLSPGASSAVHFLLLVM